MREPMIRGHLLLGTLDFLRTQSRGGVAQRLEDELSPDLQRALDGMTPAGWYPRSHHAELLAKLALKGRDDATYRQLMHCGAGLAVTENQFSSLLLKVLTPQLFLKKLPKFWSRDHTAGGLEAEAFDATLNSARVHLKNVPGYDYSGIVWMGWMKRMLDEICGSPVQVRQTGWSWSEPGPRDVVYEVQWS
jgi:hypothetical protein